MESPVLIAPVKADPPARSAPELWFGARWRGSTAQAQVLLIAGSVLLALVLRLPFVNLPLRIDEGGLALVGQTFLNSRDHGTSLYGNLWIDRPPLLIVIYGAAQVLGGALAVRLLGVVGAVAIIVLAARLTIVLRAPRALVYACGVAVLLTSSPALGASFAYPELLAAATVAACAFVCIRALVQAEPDYGGATWVMAGVLAASAVLLKQSFLDGLSLGLVAALAASRSSSLRATVLPFLAGVAAPVLIVLAWAQLEGPGARSLIYAMFGFRIDGAHALAHATVPMSQRFELLGKGAFAAGLVVLIPLAVAGLVIVRREHGKGIALVGAAWLGAGMVGVLGGGYYWTHYLIQLIPVLAVLGGIGVASIGYSGGRYLVAGAFTAIVVFSAVIASQQGLADSPQRKVLAAAGVISANSEPGDSIFVTYSRANLVYYSGVAPAFPYQWSLMYRAMPQVEPQLRSLLRSDDRPAWIISWQSTRAFGLDRSGTTAQLITAYYRQVANECGHPILLRRDDRRNVTIPAYARAACPQPA